MDEEVEIGGGQGTTLKISLDRVYGILKVKNLDNDKEISYKNQVFATGKWRPAISFWTPGVSATLVD